jgi:hypothetical protein
MPGKLVHQKNKMVFSFANNFPASSIAVFSICDINIPRYLLCGQKVMKYIKTIERR